MIFEPTSLPATWICWPLALPGNASSLTPVISSGYTSPSRIANTMTPMIDVTMSRFISVEVCGQALNDRAEEQGREERQRADEDDHANKQDHERGIVGAHRAEARGGDPLAGQGSGDRQREQDRGIPRKYHVEA